MQALPPRGVVLHALVGRGITPENIEDAHTFITGACSCVVKEQNPGFDLLLEPQLSIVLFTLDGWTRDDYLAWSTQRAREGVALLVPTTWKGQPCMRICLVNPRTRLDDVRSLLDDLAGFPLRR